MRLIEIKDNQLEALENICYQFGVKFQKSDNMKWSQFGDYKVWLVKLDHIIKKDWKVITQHIMSFAREKTRSIYASVYYSLYSCNSLKLENHPYAYYTEWKDVNPYGYELDHKMPKWHYPELTFNPQNWQALTKKENKEKKAKVRLPEAKEYVNLRMKGFDKKVQSLLF